MINAEAISFQATMLSLDEDWADSCYTTNTKESGKYASICDIISIKDLISQDFRATAKCNYYTTEDKFAYLQIVMAFQVLVLFVNRTAEQCCFLLSK